MAADGIMSKSKTLALGAVIGLAVITANMLGLLAPFKLRASDVGQA